MPPRDWFIRLEDILASIERIEQSLNGFDYEGFENNPDKIDVVVRHLTVIGEAANHIPDGVQNNFPQIPWHNARELRNFVVHEYFGITLSTIWDTVKNRLPQLKTQIASIIKQGREAFQTVGVTKKKKGKRPGSRMKKR